MRNTIIAILVLIMVSCTKDMVEINDNLTIERDFNSLKLYDFSDQASGNVGLKMTHDFGNGRVITSGSRNVSGGKFYSFFANFSSFKVTQYESKETIARLGTKNYFSSKGYKSSDNWLIFNVNNEQVDEFTSSVSITCANYELDMFGGFERNQNRWVIWKSNQKHFIPISSDETIHDIDYRDGGSPIFINDMFIYTITFNSNLQETYVNQYSHLFQFINRVSLNNGSIKHTMFPNNHSNKLILGYSSDSGVDAGPNWFEFDDNLVQSNTFNVQIAYDRSSHWDRTEAYITSRNEVVLIWDAQNRQTSNNRSENTFLYDLNGTLKKNYPFAPFGGFAERRSGGFYRVVQNKSGSSADIIIFTD